MGRWLPTRIIVGRVLRNCKLWCYNLKNDWNGRFQQECWSQCLIFSVVCLAMFWWKAHPGLSQICCFAIGNIWALWYEMRNWLRKYMLKKKGNLNLVIGLQNSSCAARDYPQGYYLIFMVTGSLVFSDSLSYLADVWCTMSAQQRVLFIGMKKWKYFLSVYLPQNYTWVFKTGDFCCFLWLCLVSLWILHVKESLNLLLKQLLFFWNSHSLVLLQKPGKGRCDSWCGSIWQSWFFFFFNTRTLKFQITLESLFFVRQDFLQTGK